MNPHGSTVLKRITLPQLTVLLHQLGFRAKVISPALIESASNGMLWQVELRPLDQQDVQIRNF
jgi:hypothetical protein